MMLPKHRDRDGQSIHNYLCNFILLPEVLNKIRKYVVGSFFPNSFCLFFFLNQLQYCVNTGEQFQPIKVALHSKLTVLLLEHLVNARVCVLDTVLITSETGIYILFCESCQHPRDIHELDLKYLSFRKMFKWTMSATLCFLFICLKQVIKFNKYS